jgi:hypothetical protein
VIDVKVRTARAPQPSEVLSILAPNVAERDADDAEAALDELIRVLLDPPEPIALVYEPRGAEDLCREDEFACESCHLILHNSRLAGTGRALCVDCRLRA